MTIKQLDNNYYMVVVVGKITLCSIEVQNTSIFDAKILLILQNAKIWVFRCLLLNNAKSLNRFKCNLVPG